MALSLWQEAALRLWQEASCGKRQPVARGIVWQEAACVKRQPVSRGSLWQEASCGKRQPVARGRLWQEADSLWQEADCGKRQTACGKRQTACGKRQTVARGSVWQEAVCGKRQCVARGSVWQEAACGKRQPVARGRQPVARGGTELVARGGTQHVALSMWHSACGTQHVARGDHSSSGPPPPGQGVELCPHPAVGYRQCRNLAPTPHCILIGAQGYQRFSCAKPVIGSSIALHAVPAVRTSTYLVSCLPGSFNFIFSKCLQSSTLGCVLNSESECVLVRTQFVSP